MLEMQVLGIRTSPQTVRYAVLEWNSEKWQFVNANKEHQLHFPATHSTPDEKVLWLYDEITRIIGLYPDIKHIAIKVNEFGAAEQKKKRLSSYLDAVVILAAAQNQIPLSIKLYRNMNTKRSDVKKTAECYVCKSDSYWNVQMADAVVAAISVEKE